MKTICTLVGAFFLVGGLAILIAGPPKSSAGAGPARSVRREGRESAHRPLLWEADGARTGPPAAAEAVSRHR